MAQGFICHDPLGNEVECAPSTPTAAPEVIAATTNVAQQLQTLDMAPSDSQDGGAGAENTAARTQIQDLEPSFVTATQAPIATGSVSASSNGRGGGNGLSGGAVAGIAIATAIAGGAIAFFIAFMLFRKKARNSQNEKFDSGSYSDSAPELVGLQKSAVGIRGGTTYVQVSQRAAPQSPESTTFAPSIPHPKKGLDMADFSGSSDFLASVLAPAADEHAVGNKIAAVFSQVQQHVETFYRDVHASITPSMEPDLVRFGGGDTDMVELLRDASTPTNAIQHALASYILGITSPPLGEGGETLFPAEIIGMQGGLKSNDTALSAATLLYRGLATHIYTSTTQTPTPTQISAIREAAEHFSLTFFPWANPTYGDQEKDEDLVHIITSILDLRIWLHGQPFLYDFIWEDGVRMHGIVVKPGLVRTSDAQGRVGERHVVLESVVVAS